MPWMQTGRSHSVDLLEPDPKTIDILDIAHALSLINRFNGHTSKPYSVAEHCCHIYDYLLKEHGHLLALGGLLHDAGEAYVGDITYPVQMALKEMGGSAFNSLKVIYSRVDDAIMFQLGLPKEILHHPKVKEADQRILLDERNRFLGWDVEKTGSVPLGVEFWPATVRRDPEVVEALWLDRFVESFAKVGKLSNVFEGDYTYWPPSISPVYFNIRTQSVPTSLCTTVYARRRDTFESIKPKTLENRDLHDFLNGKSQ